MTTVADTPARSPGRVEGEPRPAPAAVPAPTAVLAPPPKLRRRPLLVAASVAAICLGALVSVWAYTSTSTTREVLAVRRTVDRGQVIRAGDLMSVRISVDPALHPLPATQASTVVGRHAALDMPAGGVVTASQVTDQPVPARGDSVVGISLTAAMLPSNQLKVGDPVRVVATSSAPGDTTTGTPAPQATAAIVVGLTVDASTGSTIVNVELPHADAPTVAALAASGKVAIVADSAER